MQAGVPAPPGRPFPPPGHCFPARCGAAWRGYRAACAGGVGGVSQCQRIVSRARSALRRAPFAADPVVLRTPWAVAKAQGSHADKGGRSLLRYRHRSLYLLFVRLFGRLDEAIRVGMSVTPWQHVCKLLKTMHLSFRIRPCDIHRFSTVGEVVCLEGFGRRDVPEVPAKACPQSNHKANGCFRGIYAGLNKCFGENPCSPS